MYTISLDPEKVIILMFFKVFIKKQQGVAGLLPGGDSKRPKKTPKRVLK